MDELYPRGPTAVPAAFVEPPAEYRRQAWRAVAALLGFVALYLSLTAWFLYRAVTLLVFTPPGHRMTFWTVAVGIVALFLGFFLAKALLFIPTGRRTDDLEIDAATQPELVAFVHRIADDARALRPHRIYLQPGVNACVFYHLSVLNLLVPSRKNLGIGLGLVNALTLGELKAVLAHEFGHFAQRTMAVGRYVYIGRQIAARLVSRRDAVDRFLDELSVANVRIAWVGWIILTIVWAIRAVIEAVFRVVVLAELALSREMELQADRVAVSLTGSDALVHALYKLRAADDALDRAASVAARQLHQGRSIPDLYALQSRVMHHMRRVVGEHEYDVPPAAAGDAAAHRVFEPGPAQAPQMWSTHPPSHVREDAAKAVYLAAPADDRDAWVLFRDAPALRRKLTTRVLADVERPQDVTEIGDDEAIVRLDDGFARPSLHPRYRGLYLGRRPAGHAATIAAMYEQPLPSDPQAIRDALKQLYPEALAADVTRWRRLEDEIEGLQALRDDAGTAEGTIHHRGLPVRRKDLPWIIDMVRKEVDEAYATVCAHDRRCRAVHGGAAMQVGRGWPEYLGGLASLLHFADHLHAEVGDAAAAYFNVLAVVTADGHLSQIEVTRLCGVAFDLYNVLHDVSGTGAYVSLPPAVVHDFGAESWAAALPESLSLIRPAREQLGSFSETIADWVDAYLGPLGALRSATLETLLRAEEHVGRSFLEGLDPGLAPPCPSVPSQYYVRLRGQARPRYRKRDVWDQFRVGDGIGPGFARFAVALSIVGTVVFYSGAVGTTTAKIHNGLDRAVVVHALEEQVEVAPFGAAEIDLPEVASFELRTELVDGREVERFEVQLGDRAGDYVYNVASASALVQWWAVYGPGRKPDPRPMGAPRWTTATFDYAFEEPPATLETHGESTTRTVIVAVDGGRPDRMLGRVRDESQQRRMTWAHARFDDLDGRFTAAWLAALSPEDGAEVLVARLQEQPEHLVLRRMQQDTASPADRAEICAADRAAAHERPTAPDLQYLAARCEEDPARRAAVFLQLRERFPDHGFIAFAAGVVLVQRGAVEAGIERLAFARSTAPGIAEGAAVFEARARRMRDGAGKERLEDLVDDAPLIETLVAVRGQALPDVMELRPYYHLVRGDIAAATQSTLRTDAPLLRRLAASDGADEALIAAVASLPPPAPGDDTDLLYATALARRTGAEPPPPGDDPALAALLRFTDRAFLTEDEPARDAALAALDLHDQGLAAAAATIVLGDDTPDALRALARAILFPFERPYFR
jgi:Zn-dependent protease with chaperone function